MSRIVDSHRDSTGEPRAQANQRGPDSHAEPRSRRSMRTNQPLAGCDGATLSKRGLD
jgi:hypothetical protein